MEPTPTESVEPKANSETTIHERMVAILSELPPIGKTQRNEPQKFMFRGHDDVLNALNPLLSKHGVYVVPDVLERATGERATGKGSTMYEVNLHVRYRFYGKSGDYIEASAWGEGTDMGDKSTNKAMTMAFKNVLAQAFAISTAELADTDGGTPEETRRGGATSQAAPTGDGWVAPKDWPDLAKRLGVRLGADEAPTWMAEVASKGYAADRIGAVVADPGVADETKADLWRRVCRVLHDLDTADEDVQLRPDHRAFVAGVFSAAFDGALAFDGPAWSLGPAEADSRPQKADVLREPANAAGEHTTAGDVAGAQPVGGDVLDEHGDPIAF